MAINILPMSGLLNGVIASSTHREYDYYKSIWTMVDDFVLGEKQVKSKGELYLPKHPKWNDAEYVYYKELAPFTNFTVRTINALLGAMFLKDPLILLPDSISYMNDNADGKGNNLQQVVRRVALEGIKKGRSGVLVDFPNVVKSEGVDRPTLADTQNLKARVVMYDALSIVDWEEDDNGLTMVKLLENKTVRNQSGKALYETQERVLELVDGVYRVTISKTSESDFQQYYPTDANGNNFDVIPFFFNGAVNNDATCDNSPVYEIVSKNKTHYQLEAEIFRSIRLVGSPMATISIGDISVAQFLEVNGLEDQVLEFGSSRGLIVGTGGQMTMVQPSANGMAESKAKQVIEEAMMLGARLVTKSTGRATAEQIRIETSAENAIINSIAKNIEATIKNALKFAQMFMVGSYEESTFSMNTEFFAQNPDAQILLFAKEMMADPSMTFAPNDMFTLLKNSGLIDANRSIEEVMKDAEKYRELVREMEAISTVDESIKEKEIDNGTEMNVSVPMDNRLK